MRQEEKLIDVHLSSSFKYQLIFYKIKKMDVRLKNETSY
jgi:hypothetical protein